MKCPSPKFLFLAVAVAWMVSSNAGCLRRSKAQPAPTAPPPATAQVPSPTEPPKPPEPAPELGPNITDQEKARAQESANDLMNRTDNNLKLAQDKALSKGFNPSQKDLLERSHSFLKQAHAAAQTGDWARASNLAQKAFLLSEDLLHSLP